MQENETGTENTNEDAPQSFILITFKEPGSAEAGFQFQGVTPIQIFGILPVLEMQARATITEQPRKAIEVARTMDLVRDHRKPS